MSNEGRKCGLLRGFFVDLFVWVVADLVVLRVLLVDNVKRDYTALA
jgi:hypothetical protein